LARRKTLKKNQYQEFPNCFDRHSIYRGKWREYFGNDHPLILELGCGKAALSFELAQRHPQHNYLGVDLKMDRMWKPAGDALNAGIDNLAFLCADLREIGEHFSPHEVDALWITFPDPFPKKRQAKHRMIMPPFLQQYRAILKPGGRVYYKTDNLALFHFSLEVFVRQGNIHFHELTFDLHAEEAFPEEWKIETTYEKEFRAMGETINLVVFEFV